MPERSNYTIVPIEITTGHTASENDCCFCGSPLEKAWARREQWASKVRVVATAPIYLCTGCGVEFGDSAAVLEFKQKELKVLERYGDRKFIPLVRQEIQAAIRQRESLGKS